MSERAKRDRYNGYTNYATWNVCLWLGNDEGLYDALLDGGYSLYRADAADAERIVEELLPNGTPDESDLSSVDWDEVAEYLREVE